MSEEKSEIPQEETEFNGMLEEGVGCQRRI